MSVTGAIAFDRHEMERGDTFERHVHPDWHQVAWASAGVLMVDVGDRCWVLPPHLALWIPAGTWHRTIALRDTVFEGIYVERSHGVLDWPEPTVLAVSPLAHRLLEHLARDLTPPQRHRGEALLVDVLHPVSGTTVELPMPREPRARAVADLLLADPADTRGLEQLATATHSSARTLLRLFVAETGMTFAQWRTHARVQAAITHLAGGTPVAQVATLVGYATPSAFVAVFRRLTGHTPARYFARPQLGGPVEAAPTPHLG